MRHVELDYLGRRWQSVEKAEDLLGQFRKIVHLLVHLCEPLFEPTKPLFDIKTTVLNDCVDFSQLDINLHTFSQMG